MVGQAEGTANASSLGRAEWVSLVGGDLASESLGGQIQKSGFYSNSK